MPAIQGISNFYAVESFFRNLGLLISSITKSLARAPPSSTSENPFGYIGINFTVVLHNLGSKKAIIYTRVCSRYKHESRSIRKLQMNKKEQEHKDNMALEEICAIWAIKDISVSDQAIAVISSTIVLGKAPYSSFEGNFFPGWATVAQTKILKLAIRWKTS